MAFRLTPHERGFYPLFTRAAENIATTADCLAELVGTMRHTGPSSRERSRTASTWATS